MKRGSPARRSSSVLRFTDALVIVLTISLLIGTVAALLVHRTSRLRAPVTPRPRIAIAPTQADEEASALVRVTSKSVEGTSSLGANMEKSQTHVRGTSRRVRPAAARLDPKAPSLLAAATPLETRREVEESRADLDSHPRVGRWRAD